jgi:preprotein translocase subunit SecF
MDIIGKRYVFLGASLLLVVASIAAIFILGFREGIDFKGGTLWSLHFDQAPSVDALRSYFASDLKHEAIVTETNSTDRFVRFESISENDHQDFLEKLKTKFDTARELSFQSIGPAIGEELRRNALIALVMVMVAISLYIAFAFRKVSAPVSSWKYGIVTLITLVHDVAIPAGLYAFLGQRFGVEIDTNFIVALLVVMGFSVHDTIVVFDRIRENLLKAKNRYDLNPIVNTSVNETFARSLNTSLTLIIVLVALILMGPESLRYFILTILVGVVAGVYSSIFVASPLLTVWHDWGKRHKK